MTRGRPKVQKGDPPTTRQAEVYEFLKSRIVPDWSPTTLRDVCERFDIDIHAASCHLAALEKRGLIVRREKRTGMRVLLPSEVTPGEDEQPPF